MESEPVIVTVQTMIPPTEEEKKKNSSKGSLLAFHISFSHKT